MDRGTRRFIGIALTMLIGLSLLTAGLSKIYLPKERADIQDEGVNWRWSGDGTMVVFDDLTWRDLRYVLDHKIRVVDGATFKLMGCTLEMPLELLLERTNSLDDWISILPGSALKLVDGEVVITHDPALDEALICAEDWNNDDIPNLWRVVDLRDATMPTLEFDLEFLMGESYVVVAVEEEPGAGLDLLEVIGPAELRDWQHHSILLNRYVGTTPRVVLFVHNVTRQDVMISGLTVTDGGEPLSDDNPLSADPRDDGWYLYGFEGYWSYVSSQIRNRPALIHNNGQLVIKGSLVGGVPGLGRYNPNKYYPQLTEIEGSDGSSLLQTVVKGLEIMSENGTVSISSSDVSYVPVTAINTQLVAVKSVFSGHDELITAFSSWGSIEDCEFYLVEPDIDRGKTGFSSTDWLLAFEASQTPFTLDACTFNGHGARVGICINLDEVQIARSYIDGVKLGVWNHALEPDLWSDYRSGLEYGPGCELAYLQTMTVEIQHVYRDDPDYSENDDWDGMPIDGGPDLPVSIIGYVTTYNTLASLPVLLVGPDGEVEEVHALTVRVGPYWTSRDDFTIDPLEGYITVVLGEEHDPSYDIFDYAYFEMWEWETNGTGMLQQALFSFLWASPYTDATFKIFFDGHLQQEYPMDVDSNTTWDDSKVIYRNITIPEGRHNSTFSIMVNQTGPDPVEILNYTTEYLRVTSDVSYQTTQDLFGGRSGTLMLDPGVSLEGISYTNRLDIVPISGLTIVLGAGSRVVFEEFNAGDTWYNDHYVVGDGELVIRSLGGADYRGAIVNATLKVEEIVAKYVEMYTYGSDILIEGRVMSSSMTFDLRGTNMTMTGVTVSDAYEFEVVALHSNVTLRDTGLSGDIGLDVAIDMKGDSSLVVDGCIFKNSNLEVPLVDTNTTVAITDCTFEGVDSYIMLTGGLPGNLWELSSGGPYIRPTFGSVAINDCTFVGPGAGLMFDIDCTRGDLAGNDFRDGAWALTYLWPNITYDDDPFNGTTHYLTTMTSFALIDRNRYSNMPNGWYFRLLIDVTEDPSGALDRGMIQLVLTETNRMRNQYDTIIGYESIPVDIEILKVQVPIWDPIDVSILLLLDSVSIEDNWWTV